MEKIIVSLDIGTTKICVIVARPTADGKFEILGVGKADSLGLMRGVITNIDRTVQGIRAAIEMAEKESGCDISEVYVGIAGQHIKSLRHRGYVMRDNHTDEIRQADIDRLIKDMYKLVLPPGDRIIHVIPQEFIVDHEEGVKDPIGMSGVRLEADFHIITGQIAATENIYRCVERSGLEVAGLVLEPIASCAAVLDHEEKEAGIALVDIGGGTTDIAIFQEGLIRHTAVIPLGGKIVTEDIKEGCLVMRPQAEQMKVKFGSALALESMENEIISIPGLRGRDPKQISVKNLAHIIQARMEEILEHVYHEVKRSGFELKLIGGIVATGGGAQLKNLKHLVEYMTGYDARIGIPSDLLSENSLARLKSPMYATSLGLLAEGYKEELKKERELAQGEPVPAGRKKSWWDKIVGGTKGLLEGDPDEYEEFD